MLKLIHIRNFALAENLRIEFGKGLNILTGETGAGKSILIGAIAAVLGDRVYTDVVRTGFEKAFVDAIFDVESLPPVKELLQSKGIEANSELFLRREISIKGNSRAFINDVAVTVTTLSEIGDLLLDIHGQHQHQSLLRRDTHRTFLDALGKLVPNLEAVAQKYEEVKSVEKLLQDLKHRQQELISKYELYTFQAQEIEKAALAPGEDEALEAERKILSNVEKLYEISNQLDQIFNGDQGSLLEMIGEADHRLKELGGFAPDMEKLHEEFSTAKIVFEETSRSIEEFQNNLEFDPQRLEEVESRLNQISQLKRKYGASIEKILNYLSDIRETLNLQENYEFEIEKLNKQYEQAIADYSHHALQLSENRKKVARQLETTVQQQLAELGMPRMRFQINLDKIEDSEGIYREEGKTYLGDEYGVDQIDFYISPNPGEDFKALNKIASGGEISRIMLALKSLLAENDKIPTLVFDEIDSGVSGRIAQAVGRSIRQLSRSHQIICVTHLPQIASHGEAHYLVEKYVENERTFTTITPLNDQQRIEALARLMAGEKISDTVLESAKQLLEESKNG